MAHLIEVAFKGNRREFFHWEGEEPPRQRTAVIVEADRGEDLGTVHAVGALALQRFAGVAHGEPSGVPPRQALRPATAEEAARARELREADEEARRRGMERVRAHDLVMKLSDAEWQWDRKKLTFYFTAEKRVDFRALVRDLAATFRARIELRQIGVRDEAKRLDGVGRCGRQYCSASWLPELRPVNLGVAKDQGLSLNPLQISGACGRLMCCLRYEHEFYVQSRKRFPKEGKILVTALGEEKVVANDIFNDRVTLRNPEGDVRVVPLAELKAELAALPAAPAAGAEGPADPAAAAEAVRERRTLPLREGRSAPRGGLPGRPPRTAAPRPTRESSRPADDAPMRLVAEHVTAEYRVPTPAPPADAGAEPTAASAGEPQHAAILPLGTPEAAEADEQRQRADAGEAPLDGDVTATGDDRRRRRRGRRGGRRGRGRREQDPSAGAAGESSDPAE